MGGVFIILGFFVLCGYLATLYTNYIKNQGKQNE